MSSIYATLLAACESAVDCQRELTKALAAHLGVPVEKILYTWAGRLCQQSGSFDDSGWDYFFHGLECDLKNGIDGRFLRVDFGPAGSVDTFTSWGVLQFIMASKTPWPEYEDLKRYFAGSPPPYNQFSGSLGKIDAVWDTLAEKGLIEKADQALIDYELQNTYKGSDGITRIKFPENTPTTLITDCAVAGRYKLSQAGNSLLENMRSLSAG